MSNIFNKIQLETPRHSTFDMSYDVKLSLKMGDLVPVHIQECIPGDHFRCQSEAMFRMMPLVSPIMHKVDIYIHHFFVPNRLLWEGWEKFITGGQVGTVSPAFPVMNTTGMVVNPSSLDDYLGVPLGTYGAPGLEGHATLSALPYAAYQRIWWDYYRDQNMQNYGLEEFPTLNNGQQGTAVQSFLRPLRKRAWEHDYFTSALPFAQKGDAVTIPIDVSGNVSILPDRKAQGWEMRSTTTGGSFAFDTTLEGRASNLLLYAMNKPTGALNGVYFDPKGNLRGEFTDAQTSTTINDLRTAISLQKWAEKNARGGTRLKEMLLAHFGVRSSDQRLDRPEYLGGSRASMAISEVLQTSSTVASETPQGNMAGHGVAITSGRDFSYRVEEHGYIIGILSIRPKTAYQQGIPRHFLKNDRTLYYWPDFAQLGEQPIFNCELYQDFAEDASTNMATFGYIPRYSEYRYNPSRVAGQMRTTLNHWHMGRIFESRPALNENFIMANPTRRIYAVDSPSEDTIIAHIYHKIHARRPLPLYGNPGGL